MKKTIKFTSSHIETLPNNRPGVYVMGNARDPNLYTGSAKATRVQARLKEHGSGGSDPIPGVTKVTVHYQPSIAKAQKVEQAIIAREKPKHNKTGK